MPAFMIIGNFIKIKLIALLSQENISNFVTLVLNTLFSDIRAHFSTTKYSNAPHRRDASNNFHTQIKEKTLIALTSKR